jgi:2-polyprenyl-3-methyl-5-hydroxy-6-metoxy-1,4-benzoquinol methylase
VQKERVLKVSQYADSSFNEGKPNSSWYKTFQLIPGGSTVLDIGCSSGVFGERLIQEKNCTVDGIEIDSGDIKEARKKLRNVHKLNVELDDLSIEERYDIIFMGDVIEHFAKPIEALMKLKKLLNSTGSLVFSIPNITHMSVRLMLLRGNIEYGKTGLLDETHLHFYNREEVYRVMNAAGLKITKFDYVERDIPLDIINDELKEIGLVANDAFRQIAQSINGAAYQFIGKAIPSKAITEPLPIKSPIDLTEKNVNNLKKKYEKEIQSITNEKNVAIEELRQIKNSRVWRLVSAYNNIVKSEKK